MVIFKELKDICNHVNGNLFFKEDEVGIYYTDSDERVVVLDISDGFHEDWEHISAKDIVNDLCSGSNELLNAEDDWRVVVDCCSFVEINAMTISNDGNVILS